MNYRHVTLGLAIATFIAGAALKAPSEQKPPKPTVDFNRDVRPILAKHCWACHGQDKDQLRKTGGFSLDSFEGATTTRYGKRAIVPGFPEKSDLVSRAAAKEMPPSDSGLTPLSPAELETITTWIKEGAEFRAHWAFVPPKSPAIPKVKNKAWIRNEIDNFVLERLESNGLSAAPEADKRTLIRRATLTLTGLPPTPQEISVFLKDNRKDAYERLVDRLLASPRYGENQARYWLDAVRYADTHGLHIDNERSIYPYRDWVVRAYNQDLPYNKFALWQIAGDLLPNPTLDQKIATGYVRLNPTTNEGGAIEAEFLAKNTFDRVDTTATVFMGVTLQCAKCHDHKYDPFSQKDYYSLYAYFDSTADTPLDGNARLHEPVMPAPSPEQAAKLAILGKSLAEVESKTSLAAATAWARSATVKLPSVGSWFASDVYPAKDFDSAFATEFGPEVPTAKAKWKPIKFELDKPYPTLIGKENAALYLKTTLTAESPTKLNLRLGSDDGIRVWLNGALVHSNKVLRALAANSDVVSINLKPGPNILLVKVVNQSGEDGAFVGLGGSESQKLNEVRTLAMSPRATPEQEKQIVQTYLVMGPEGPQAKRYRQLLAAQKAQEALIPMTYVAKELPMARQTFLLRRGQYDLPGEQVTRAIPKVFGTLPDSKNNNRLGLAEWIIGKDNPLTSRVLVNRIWQQHFGQGLVKSSEDFGSRGDWPSHPELLDYLACRFVNDGWSIKKLTRLILTSSAYRQSAAASPAKRQKDPDNTLISRGPRFRLDAEVIRDTALFVSGILEDKPGGHSDKPYQPSGLWEIIAYPISDTAKYMQDHGDALYRRSLYMFWKRTSPPPTMLLFDAPMRESCVVRRSKTNTPTQALATLNETGFFEDARAMAQRVIKAKTDDKARIEYAFSLATGRAPSQQEIGVVDGFLKDAKEKYRSNPKEADRTLAIGESPRDKTIPAPVHAAWALVCNMILNLDETLTLH